MTTFICDGEGGCQREVGFKFKYTALEDGVQLVTTRCNNCDLPYDSFLGIEELSIMKYEIEKLSMRLRDGKITPLAYDLRVKDIKDKQKRIYNAYKQKYAKELE